MAVDNIFQRYGIKEVADISFYSIKDGKPDKLELYIDTAKTSTIEQTAESVDARGGKGNPALISWDYGKEITVTLEDALFSAKSMQMMFGDVSTFDETIEHSYYNVDNVALDKLPEKIAASFPADMGVKKENIEIIAKYGKDGEASESDLYLIRYKFVNVSQHVINVTSSSFPGTYYIVGDTYARNETNGKDEFFQFIIPKAKMNVENTLTLQAEGDPTVFNMSLKVLRPADGTMMKLIKYDLGSTEL